MVNKEVSTTTILDISEKQIVRTQVDRTGCPVAWGNCVEGAEARFFGKPSLTPHRCNGVPRHKSKLHLCEKCGAVGSLVRPIRGTKAGRELSNVLAFTNQRRQATTTEKEAE